MNPRIELLLQYLKEDPTDSFSKYALALEYIKLERDDLASPLMESLHADDPGYLPNYYHFGKLLERVGNRSRAGEIYSLGMEMARSQGNTHTLSELRGALDLLED